MFVSHPSDSIDTETTHLMASPSFPCFPTVFTTSRRSSWSDMSFACWFVNLCLRNSSISCAAIFLKLGSRASPDSSCWLSMSSVGGLGIRFPSSLKFRNSGNLPCQSVDVLFSVSIFAPDMNS